MAGELLEQNRGLIIRQLLYSAMSGDHGGLLHQASGPRGGYHLL